MGERKNKGGLDRIERRILCNLLLIVAAYAFGVCLGVSMDKTDRKRVDMEQTDVIKCNTDIEEKHKIAITFDDDVIIGLSQEISYKEAVSMI